MFDKIILEVKGVGNIGNEHIAQTINYLKISGCESGLLSDQYWKAVPGI
ncbi:GxxExxY protein [Calditrichota bacterium LG24]